MSATIEVKTVTISRLRCGCEFLMASYTERVESRVPLAKCACWLAIQARYDAGEITGGQFSRQSGLHMAHFGAGSEKVQIEVTL